MHSIRQTTSRLAQQRLVFSDDPYSGSQLPHFVFLYPSRRLIRRIGILRDITSSYHQVAQYIETDLTSGYVGELFRPDGNPPAIRQCGPMVNLVAGGHCSGSRLSVRFSRSHGLGPPATLYQDHRGASPHAHYRHVHAYLSWFSSMNVRDIPGATRYAEIT